MRKADRHGSKLLSIRPLCTGWRNHPVECDGLNDHVWAGIQMGRIRQPKGAEASRGHMSVAFLLSVRGRPGRGSSDSPSMRSFRKRRRHLPTVCSCTPISAATAFSGRLRSAGSCGSDRRSSARPGGVEPDAQDTTVLHRSEPSRHRPAIHAPSQFHSHTTMAYTACPGLFYVHSLPLVGVCVKRIGTVRSSFPLDLVHRMAQSSGRM